MTQGSGVGAGRSTAIVLFTDLVGSTELRSRLGEHVAEQLRHKHDALVAGAVEASRGNLVKNLGDGVMATFVGASPGAGRSSPRRWFAGWPAPATRHSPRSAIST